MGRDPDPYVSESVREGRLLEYPDHHLCPPDRVSLSQWTRHPLYWSRTDHTPRVLSFESWDSFPFPLRTPRLSYLSTIVWCHTTVRPVSVFRVVAPRQDGGPGGSSDVSTSLRNYSD